MSGERGIVPLTINPYNSANKSTVAKAYQEIDRLNSKINSTIAIGSIALLGIVAFTKGLDNDGNSELIKRLESITKSMSQLMSDINLMRAEVRRLNQIVNVNHANRLINLERQMAALSSSQSVPAAFQQSFVPISNVQPSVFSANPILNSIGTIPTATPGIVPLTNSGTHYGMNHMSGTSHPSNHHHARASSSETKHSTEEDSNNLY